MPIKSVFAKAVPLFFMHTHKFLEYQSIQSYALSFLVYRMLCHFWNINPVICLVISRFNIAVQASSSSRVLSMESLDDALEAVDGEVDTDDVVKGMMDAVDKGGGRWRASSFTPYEKHFPFYFQFYSPPPPSLLQYSSSKFQDLLASP